MILLIGPFVAGIGLVAVFFVFRHKAVQKQSLYSSRRTQIERKVRAARQRTLAPAKRGEAAATAVAAEAPPDATQVSPPGKPVQRWESSPTAPATAQPAYTPPPATPAPPAAPAYTPPPAQEPVWTPGPTPSEPASPADTASGSSWSVVEGDKQMDMASAAETKSPIRKGAWSLATGQDPDSAVQGDEPKTSRQGLAIAQYAVFVVGLIMVLIGVVVMVANSKLA